MTKAFTTLEARRRERAFEDFRREWWWFNDANAQHVHQFSAAWEILRRTRAFNVLHERVKRWRSIAEKTERGSFEGFLQRAHLMSSLHEMLPESPPAPQDYRDMVGVWQNMLVHGWTPEKTYLEASQNSAAECVFPDGKVVRIPPSFGPRNSGIPIILPRQVASSGHVLATVNLCEIAQGREHDYKIVHCAGPRAPTDMLISTQRHAKPLSLENGVFVAILFSMHHPTEAIKKLVKASLDRLEGDKGWRRRADSPDVYSRGAQLVGTLNPFEVVALFSADEPRNVIERGFGTLLRPKRLAKHHSRLRKEWVEWDFAERVRFAPHRERGELIKEARDAWMQTRRFGHLSREITTRPIRPAEDLKNLACRDCTPFYERNRAELPDALPEELRKDADFNKRTSTGARLVNSQDQIFLPLLKSVRPRK